MGPRHLVARVDVKDEQMHGCKEPDAIQGFEADGGHGASVTSGGCRSLSRAGDAGNGLPFSTQAKSLASTWTRPVEN